MNTSPHNKKILLQTTYKKPSNQDEMEEKIDELELYTKKLRKIFLQMKTI